MSIPCFQPRGKNSIFKSIQFHICTSDWGSIDGFNAKVYLKDGAIPKFMKARNVPFSLQDVVNDELDRLENDGILKTVPFSDWASPIVIVPKPDGGARRASINVSSKWLHMPYFLWSHIPLMTSNGGLLLEEIR